MGLQTSIQSRNETRTVGIAMDDLLKLAPHESHDPIFAASIQSSSKNPMKPRRSINPKPSPDRNTSQGSLRCTKTHFLDLPSSAS